MIFDWLKNAGSKALEYFRERQLMKNKTLTRLAIRYDGGTSLSEARPPPPQEASSYGVYAPYGANVHG